MSPVEVAWRYVVVDGEAFFVRKRLHSHDERMLSLGYSKPCLGSHAIALNRRGGERVKCPVCGKDCAVTRKRRQVHDHDRKEARVSFR